MPLIILTKLASSMLFNIGDCTSSGDQPVCICHEHWMGVDCSLPCLFGRREVL